MYKTSFSDVATADGHRDLAKYPKTLGMFRLSRVAIVTQCARCYMSPVATLTPPILLLIVWAPPSWQDTLDYLEHAISTL